MKGKEESSERMPNEIEASQLSDTEFKIMVIRKVNELRENDQKLQGNYKELTANYISIKKDIETINKDQEEMKNTISELKNTVEGSESGLMKQRIESVSWRKKEKKPPQKSKKMKKD